MKVNKQLIDYWLEHYTPKGQCSLCGNRGVIDTRGIKTPAGFECGALNYCICPNGQVMRAQGWALEEQVTRRGSYKLQALS